MKAEKGLLAVAVAVSLVWGTAATAAAMTAQEWCLSQLPKQVRGVYTAVLEGLREKKSTVSASFKGDSGSVIGSFGTVVKLLKKENPDIFWLSYEAQSCTIDGDSVVMEPHFYAEFTGAEGLDTAKVDEVEAALRRVERAVGTGEDDYESVQKINAYITGNVSYTANFQNPRAYEITGALVDGAAACEGYAKAFKYLCGRVGIDCVIVSGKGTTGGRVYDHAWNYVKLDDAWYLVDTTWNALGADKEKWFLRGRGASVDGMPLPASHAADSDGYPALCESDYVP